MSSRRSRARGGTNTFRFVFGLVAAGFFLTALVLHGAGVVSFDEVGLALLLLVAGSIVFALSRQLGITKIWELEMAVEVKEVLAALPSSQAEEVQWILERESDLFPAIGVRLLWVDDKPEVLIPHRRLLRRLGMEVVAAKNTADATNELRRDGDFTMIIQDRLRDGSVEDARSLVKWLESSEAKAYTLGPIPIVVFTFDAFDGSLRVDQKNWITRDPARLLERVADEIRHWHRHSSPVGPKPPT